MEMQQKKLDTILLAKCTCIVIYSHHLNLEDVLCE